MEAVCGCSDEKRAILVSVKVLDNQVEWKDSYSHLVKYPVNRVL